MTRGRRKSEPEIQREGRATCKNCQMRNSTLFSALSDEEIESLGQPIEKLRLPARTSLYLQGDPGKHVYTVRSGLIKLVHYGEGGVYRIVRLQRRGDVLGLEVLIDKRYRHTAEAVSEVELCQIPSSLIQQVEHTCSAIVDGLMNRMQMSLDAADDVITELSTGPAHARVARFLLMLACDEGATHCDYLSREDTASLLGLTIETVSRVFAEFKRKGVLNESGGCFRIDRMAMRQIAES